jgi:hypothetical protein
MSTSVTYSSPCHYFNTNGELQSSTTCSINFGIVGQTNQARFIVSFPDGVSEVTIFANANNPKATANDIPSEVATGGGNIVVATVEGEVFIFKAPQAGDPPLTSVSFGN